VLEQLKPTPLVPSLDVTLINAFLSLHKLIIASSTLKLIYLYARRSNNKNITIIMMKEIKRSHFQ
jgi:hypothetical protein